MSFKENFGDFVFLKEFGDKSEHVTGSLCGELQVRGKKRVLDGNIKILIFDVWQVILG